MGDFIAFADDIQAGMAYLKHHQILGAKWGQKNGPPYPLGSGDHSSAEKSAAKAAGIKVGQDSGKGSIENVKKKKSTKDSVKKTKKEMTEEEKREAALKAVRAGDKKKIAKYAEYLTSQELQDADNRVRNLSNITREEPGQKKASKAEMEKMEAIRSGDKEKVKQYADQMSYQELSEAMNKIDLTAKLNYTPPPKSAFDKMQEVADKVDKVRQVAEKGVNAYNLAAKVYNSTHNDTKWPIIGAEQKKEKSQEEKIAESLAKTMGKDIQKGVQQTKQQQQPKSFKEQSDEQLKNAKYDYKNQKKFEKWTKKQEEKEAAKEAKKAEKEEAKQKSSQQDEEYGTKLFNETVNNMKMSRLSDFDDDMSYEDILNEAMKSLNR